MHDILEDEKSKLGTFKTDNNDFDILWITHEHEQMKHNNRYVVVEGTYSHYRTDHPLSPDGFASLKIPFCITILENSTYGKRVYVST